MVRNNVTLLTGDDLYLFDEGSDCRFYEKRGYYFLSVEGNTGSTSPFGRLFRSGWCPSRDVGQ
jgi:hypothetical protein